MALVASVSSSKGGSGKSTTSINLGVALSRLGKNVTVVDANLTTPYLSMFLGAPHVPVTLHHVLNGNAHINEAIYQHASGTKIIPGSINTHKGFEKLNLDNIDSHLKHLKGDIIILDGAPGLSSEARAALKAADEVLVTATPELPSVAHSLKTIKSAVSYGKKISGVVLTRVGHNLDLKINSVETILEQPVIGLVPEDDYVKRALVKREPVVHVYPKAPASIAYQKLASFLMGHKHKDYLLHQNTEISPMYKFMKWAFGVRE